MSKQPTQGADPVEEYERLLEQARALYPLTAEQKFWIKYFPCLDPKNPKSCIAFWFVAPLTNLTNFSLYYQLYLHYIFHTTFGARFTHFSTMPVIDFMILVFFQQFPLPGYEPIKDHTVHYYTYSWAFVLAVGSMIWYSAWGFIAKNYLLGFFMLPVVLVGYTVSTVYYCLSADLSGTAPWYAPTPLPYNPVMWAIFFAFLQATGHVFEPTIPPRSNGQMDWRWNVREFFRNAPGRAILQVFAGTFDELIASPRLIPLQVLMICNMLGYHEEEARALKDLSMLCVRSGNPALDYIGIGGGEPFPGHLKDKHGRLITQDKLNRWNVENKEQLRRLFLDQYQHDKEMREHEWLAGIKSVVLSDLQKGVQERKVQRSAIMKKN